MLVSNEVGLGIIPLGELTRRFVDEAGRLNPQRLARLADHVFFVAAGLPLPPQGLECSTHNHDEICMADITPRHIGLLRHGSLDAAPALYGRSDPPLSTEGWQAFGALFEAPQLPWQRILCSPRLRCRQVAEPLAQKFNLPLEIWPELAEMDFGRWDGILYDELLAEWPRLERFWSDPLRFPLPEAEHLGDFSCPYLSGLGARPDAEPTALAAAGHPRWRYSPDPGSIASCGLATWRFLSAPEYPLCLADAIGYLAW